MSKIMSKVVPVRIASDEVNCYATIERSCLAAITACMRLGDQKHAESFTKLKAWANGNYQDKVDEHFSNSGNPAQG